MGFDAFYAIKIVKGLLTLFKIIIDRQAGGQTDARSDGYLNIFVYFVETCKARIDYKIRALFKLKWVSVWTEIHSSI